MKVGVTVNLSPGQPKINGRSLAIMKLAMKLVKFDFDFPGIFF